MITGIDLDDTEAFNVEINNYQISQIRWNKTKGSFEGFVSDGVVSWKPVTETLSDEWVAENFAADFVADLKMKGNIDTRFVCIPPGAPRTSSDLPLSLIRENAPNIVFTQGNLRSCVTDSLASALWYKGRAGLAQRIHDLGRLEIFRNGTPYQDLVKPTKNLFSRESNSFLRTIKRSIPLSRLLIESDVVCLFILRSDDGDTGHAVSIVDNWIFDSGLKMAMPLSIEGLNHACGEGVRCIGIHDGFEIIPKIKKQPNPKINKKRQIRRHKQPNPEINKKRNIRRR